VTATWSYKENGKLTGFDVDVMEAVAKKINMKLDWKLLESRGADMQYVIAAFAFFSVSAC
jgi:ABC-type amino acid transport substrate-binding protein